MGETGRGEWKRQAVRRKDEEETRLRNVGEKKVSEKKKKETFSRIKTIIYSISANDTRERDGMPRDESQLLLLRQLGRATKPHSKTGRIE